MAGADVAEKVCVAHSGFAQSLENIGRTVDRHELAIEKLQSRLPVWATLVISVLSACIGFLLGVITMLV